jgi:hypothetical protein
MGPSELFHNVSLPGIPDLADDRSHPTFYDDMAASNGDTSDGDDEDEGQLEGGIPCEEGPEGEGGVGSLSGPQQQGSPTAGEQYYVGPFDTAVVAAGSPGCSQGGPAPLQAGQHALPQLQRGSPADSVGLGPEVGNSSSHSSITHFLQLPEVQVCPRRSTTCEPLVDYSKSIIMTGDDYIKAMEEKAVRKELVEKDKELKKREAEISKEKKAQEKVLKEAAKLQRLADVRARRAFAEKWSVKAVAQAREELHQRIKSGAPPAPGAYVGKFVTFCPQICLQNQAIAMARLRAKREGRTLDPALITTPPPWVHQHDPKFLIDSEMDFDLQVPS